MTAASFNKLNKRAKEFIKRLNKEGKKKVLTLTLTLTLILTLTLTFTLRCIRKESSADRRRRRRHLARRPSPSTRQCARPNPS